MHLYLRLMKRNEADSYSASEQQGLRDFLGAAQGVQKVKTVERHLKGGYAVTLEVAPGCLESLSEIISSRGLMFVM